jgi:hypothetical protein
LHTCTTKFTLKAKGIESHFLDDIQNLLRLNALGEDSTISGSARSDPTTIVWPDGRYPRKDPYAVCPAVSRQSPSRLARASRHPWSDRWTRERRNRGEKPNAEGWQGLGCLTPWLRSIPLGQFHLAPSGALGIAFYGSFHCWLSSNCHGETFGTTQRRKGWNACLLYSTFECVDLAESFSLILALATLRCVPFPLMDNAWQAWWRSPPFAISLRQEPWNMGPKHRTGPARGSHMSEVPARPDPDPQTRHLALRSDPSMSMKSHVRLCL